MKYAKFSKILLGIFLASIASTSCQQKQEEAPEEIPTPKAEFSVAKPLLTNLSLNEEPTYSEIKQYFKTGDVIIFQEYDLSGFEIAFLEMGIADVPGYTHVGIIFELPENNGFPAGLYFWQAIPPQDVLPESYGADYFKGVVCNGAQMVSLDTMMAYLSTINGSGKMYASVRQLREPFSAAELNSLESYARQVDGRSFSYPARMQMIEDYYDGVKGKQSSDNTFFCSKLASQTFMLAGLIDSVVTNSVLPGHFALSPGDPKNLIVFKNNALDSIVQFLPN